MEYCDLTGTGNSFHVELAPSGEGVEGNIMVLKYLQL